MGVIIGGAITIGIVLRFFYPWIYTAFFHHLPEAEMQTYALGLGLFIGLLYFYKSKENTLIRGVTLAMLAVALFSVQLIAIDPKYLTQIGITTQLSPLSIVISFSFIILALSVQDVPKSVRNIVFLSIIPLAFYVGELAPYDATHFIGPIHDTLKGVPLLTSPSWYGFLPTGLLSLVFRIIPLSLINLYIVIAAVQTVGYLLLYLFALRLFKNNWWAILTIFVAILFNFLVQYGDRNYYLQSTFVRFGIWLPLAYGFLVNSKPFRIAAVTLAFFWTTDMGLYVLGSYIATLLVERNVKEMAQALLTIACTFLLITIILRPDWTNYWQFSMGFTTIAMFALPIPRSLYPWFYLTIPIVTLALTNNTLMRFLSLLSLFLFVYFTADSHLNALHSISLPAIVILMWLIRKYSTHTFLVAVAFCIPIALWGKQAIINIQKGNIVTTVHTIQQPPVTVYDIIGNVALPEKYRNDFALISPWDSYYLLAWDTTNPLGSNCLLCYWTPEAAKKLIKNMQTLDVRYIFVDKERTGYEGRVSWIFTPEVQKRYRFVETIGNLDVYEKI